MNNRIAYIAGTAAPVLFLTGLVTASRAEDGFMDGFDWRIWPAGLGLGPHGWLWAASSIALGVLLLLFSWAVAALSRIGGVLLSLAGVGALLFAFDTDLDGTGTHAETSPPFGADSLTGQLHGIGFVVFVPCVLAGCFALWRASRVLPGWRTTHRWTAVGLLLVVPGLALPSSDPIGGYAFLVVVLNPLAVLASRLGARTTNEGELA